MKFEDFNIHNNLIEKLKASISEGRIPHAQFFQGAEGSGNLALAVAYAQEVMGNGVVDMFGQADERVANLLHPDLHLSFPVIQGKTKTSTPLINEFKSAFTQNPFMIPSEWLDEMGMPNKVPIISVSESEEIYNKLSLKSYEGGYKILIVWQAELMNTACANKMLKLIEEPPAKTVILLVGEDVDQLLPTIQSRVQTVIVKPCANKEIKTFLTERGIAESEQADLILKANGSPGLALSMSQDERDSQILNSFRELMRIAFQKNVPAAIEWVESVSSKGKNFHMKLLDYGVDIYREANLMNNIPDHNMNMDERGSFIKKFSPFIRKENIQSLMETHQEVHYHISRNGNARLLLLDWAFSLMKLIKK